MRNMVKFYDTLLSWRFPMHRIGSCRLLLVAFLAIKREAEGKRWQIMELCDEVARDHEGWTQWAVWRSIQDALARSKGPKRPGEAIRALVKAVKE